MKVVATALDGVVIVKPRVFGDQRGFFLETYQAARYKTSGIGAGFVQDNISRSVAGTLRGLHYQYPRAQAKLVQVLQGEVYDVAVDIRRGSPNFGKWVGVTLSAENHHQMYIPEGFAHGFCVLSESALFMYKCSDYYVPEDEYGVQWNDPVLNIRWPVERPVLSERDLGLPALGSIAADALPSF
jgi:dTDP-4-dehydrorhamnose 3,5-epimerase